MERRGGLRQGRHTRWHCLALIALSVSHYVLKVRASPFSQTSWTANILRTSDLCFDPEAEMYGDPAEIVDVPHDVYKRRALALLNDMSDGHQDTGSAESQIDEEEEFTVTSNSADSLRKIYEYDILLSAHMMEQGLSNVGDTMNLQRTMLKLIAGQPITVVVLGGSISVGHGVRDMKNAWVTRVFDWINTTFPHPGHKLFNKAVPAVTSAYTSACVQSMVPEDTDLVLIEFTFNDSERTKSHNFDDPTRRGLERMIRKLLRLSGQPALLYVHYWANRSLRYFTDTAEDAIDTVLKYYGLMSLSMRNALHQAVEEAPALKQQIWWPPPDVDKIHPTCVGSRYLADLVIGHFQDIAASVLLVRIANERIGNALPILEKVKPPLVDDLLPPVLSNNWGNLSETCLLENEIKHLVRPINGFEWIDEGKHPGSHKWGFISYEPGSRLEVDIPITRTLGRKDKLLVGLGFLMSYAHMGMATVECVAGCECRHRIFSFFHPYASMTIWKTIEVSAIGGSHSCTLSVTSLNRTISDPPAYKVKLTSLMISEEAGFIDTWTHCDGDCHSQ